MTKPTMTAKQAIELVKHNLSADEMELLTLAGTSPIDPEKLKEVGGKLGLKLTLLPTGKINLRPLVHNLRHKTIIQLGMGKVDVLTVETLSRKGTGGKPAPVTPVVEQSAPVEQKNTGDVVMVELKVPVSLIGRLKIEPAEDEHNDFITIPVSLFNLLKIA